VVEWVRWPLRVRAVAAAEGCVVEGWVSAEVAAASLEEVPAVPSAEGRAVEEGLEQDPVAVSAAGLVEAVAASAAVEVAEAEEPAAGVAVVPR
jgi:hypothetical protein